MSYNIPRTQIYLSKTHGKVNVNIYVTDKPLSQWQRHCMGNCSNINSIQVSFAAGSQETHHWPLLLRKNTMVSQFRIFKEMENKLHEKFFFISPVFLPKTVIRWGLNPGRTGVRIICVSLVDRNIFQNLCLIQLHHLLSHISLYQVRSQLLMIISLRYLCGDPPLEQRSGLIYDRMKPNKPPVCAGSGRVNWGSSSHAEI